MDRHQALWDARYERLARGDYDWRGEPWLLEWLSFVPRDVPQTALDIGCGPGDNARLLQEQGFTVTAVDISNQALALCRQRVPGARVAWADVREGLPFAPERFALIVADLSLHYFTWDTTVAVLAEVAGRLAPGGLFAARFNSTNDTKHGADSTERVLGETNLFLVEGAEKRFFSRDCFDRLFGPTWKVVALTEKETSRFGSRKVVWEVVSTVCKATQDAASALPP